MQERKANQAITTFQIKSQDEEIAHAIHKGNEEFDSINLKVLNSWLERFLHRHNIVSRSMTSIGQKIQTVQISFDLFAPFHLTYEKIAYSAPNFNLRKSV